MSGSTGLGVLPDAVLPLVCAGCGSVTEVAATGRLSSVRLYGIVAVQIALMLPLPWLETTLSPSAKGMHLALGPTVVFSAMLLARRRHRLRLPFCRGCAVRQTVGVTLHDAGLALGAAASPTTTWLLRGTPFDGLNAGVIGCGCALVLMVVFFLLGSPFIRLRRWRWDGERLWFAQLPPATQAAWEAIARAG